MSDVYKLPGLKETELARLGPCVVCKQPMLGADVTFYCVTISRVMWSRSTVERRVGLGMLLGNSNLARAMGPDEDLAKIFDGPHQVAVHETCGHRVNSLLELVGE